MSATVIAHVTYAHLGQRVMIDGDIVGDKLRYDEASGEHEAHLRRVLADIARKGVSDIVFGGDIGTTAAVADFFNLLGDYGFKPTIVLGNHDAYADVARLSHVSPGAVEGKLCSSREDEQWRWITLDSSANTIGHRQLAWLAGELEGASRVALFVHHPVLAIDTPVDTTGAGLRDREALKAILKCAECDVTIFSGHYHMIDDAREANIRQLVTPAVSYQIVKKADRLRLESNTFGYRIVKFDDAEIRTEAVLLTEPIDRPLRDRH